MEELDEDYYNEEDEELENLMPLVGSPSSSSSNTETSPFEIALQRHQDKRVYLPSPPRNSSRLSCILLSVAVFTVGLYWRHLGSDTKEDVSDSTCNATYFQDLWEEIKSDTNSTDFCSAHLEHYLPEPCTCSLLEPAPMVNTEGNPHIGERWENAYALQREMIQNVTKSIDIIFVGDSITEHWMGTDLATPNDHYAGAYDVFKSYFTLDGGGDWEGLVLGLAAERTQNHWFRLQDGILDLNEKIQPKVFWLLIGTNDIGGELCDVDRIVAGIMANIQELRKQRPNSIVVVNGLLPWEKFIDVVSSEVNQRIECYAKVTSGVHFFNTSTVFRYPNGTKIDGLFVDRLHPNPEGYERWSERIVETLRQLGV